MRLPAATGWGILRRRYKRFLADVELPGGEVVVAHVPNPGAMRGCAAPGSPCLLSPAPAAHRTLAWTLEVVVDGGIPVGVNTGRANGLVAEALRSGVLAVPGLAPGWQTRREVRLGAHSRADFCLEDGGTPYWVEVKSVSWAVDGVARFPDAVTARGARHMAELAARAELGDRAAVVFLVQRGDARVVQAASEIDAAYARALAAARAAGVLALAVQVAIGSHALVPWRVVPVQV
ncbi:MAG TPA: DNA/RNA nuclease SfsA [Thermoanaerobaculaceae bacterium]|nr:DNA/RNA nuclease SfsA [Thermoanaerobaculaceae bacterium]HPS76894.1 DNA/RNA nuclease SfsA [Thermoanaerobaculaceae bacterium]